MTTIKAKVNGKTYTADFYNDDFGQVKYTKRCEVIDIEDYTEDGWWSILFESKTENTNWTMVVKFEVNEDGERTTNPIGAELLNEDGIIIDDYDVDVIVK